MSQPNFEEGIKHIQPRATKERLAEILKTLKSFIDSGKVLGYPQYSGLKRWHKSFSYVSYFLDADVQKLTEHMQIVAKLIIVSQRHQLKTTNVSNANFLLYSLLANHAPSIHWHSQFQVGNLHPTNGVPDCFNPDKYGFLSMQTRLALQGDWENLSRRAELWLSEPRKIKKSYDVDQRFYIALANGDKGKMEEAIRELVSPKYNRIRASENFWGLEERLFSGWGVLLAKIAFYHGFELDIGSPWIPNDWLNYSPAEDVEMPYDFVDQRDLFEPFENDPKYWCDVELLSPRPLGEIPLSYDEIQSILDYKE